MPILHVTGELGARDLTAELEALDLEGVRTELAAELVAKEAAFWSTAARGLEDAVAGLTDPAPEPPASAAPTTVPRPQPATIAATLLEPAPPGATGPAEDHPHPSRVERRHEAHRRERRRRMVGTVIVVTLLGTLATVFPSVVGAADPQRHVTITLDGRTVTRTVRAATVADVLRIEGISVRAHDRVVPAPATELQEDMHVTVLRAFPVDVEIDGATRTVRTTAQTRKELRRELGIASSLIARGPSRLAAGSTLAFRTPHTVTLQVDGRTIPVPRSAALDVGALLREQGIALGERDEVIPAPQTRLADGMRVHVHRLADNQVAERVSVPFTTQVRDDPNLPVGQTRTIQAGVPGERRDIFHITTRDDGTVVAKRQVGYELLTPPVPQIVVKGTQPIPPRATGSATWYGTGPGPGTCAHLHLPFGTMVTLTNRDTGAVAQCRVADRGPETWTGHIIDLSPDVFRRLAPLSQGIVPNLGISY